MKKGKTLIEFKEETPFVIDNPEKLPQNAEEEAKWQEKNKDFWESVPMRYDFDTKINNDEFSEAFYKEIDERFFNSAKGYLKFKKLPFDTLINYEKVKNSDVLEIGVGNGTHAQLLASHAKSFTGIDITEYAINSTTKRFQLFNLKGNLSRQDAQATNFPDNSFDYIWTWGVIHHSADTTKVVAEMNRILRPGGEAAVMVYYRSWWYYYIAGFVRGILNGDLMKYKSIHKIKQNRMDGALARYYSIRSFKKMVAPYFNVNKVRIYGQKSHLNPLLGFPGRFLAKIINRTPTSITSLFTNNLRMGMFIYVEMTKK